MRLLNKGFACPNVLTLGKDNPDIAIMALTPGFDLIPHCRGCAGLH
jgi:hypothetical protein